MRRGTRRAWWPLTLRGTGAAVLAVACFVAANQVGLVELQWFGMLLLALVAGCLLWGYAGRRRAEISRIIAPEAPPAGDDLDVHVRTRVVSAASSPAGHWSDGIPGGLEGAATGVFPAVSAGWTSGERTVEVHYRLHAAHRGVHWVGPFAVRFTDPFGLIRRTVELGDLARVVVTPAPVELTSTGAVIGRAGGTQPTPSNRYGQGADDLVARPWAPGDSMRRIHWRASAHRDELMVRQEERETSPEAHVVFDRAVERFSPAATEHPGADPRFETAVTACVSVVTRLVRDGFSVEVVDTDGGLLCEPIAGGDETGLVAMLTSFADVRARTEGPLSALTARLSGDRLGPVVVVTGAVTEAEAASLAPAASHSSLPVLLAVGSEAGAFAQARGWQGGPFADAAELPLAWTGATATEEVDDAAQW
jgi:uncharacterized protein (DUF58 family)